MTKGRPVSLETPRPVTYRRMAFCISSRFLRHLASTAVALLLVSLSASAVAQIKQPGRHPKYSVELEPHLLAQWEGPYWGGAGIGAGIRASIPVVDNGPVSTINNSLAIGFGFDWAHFGDECWNWWGPWRAPGPPPQRPDNFYAYECSGNSFIFPVVAQWNFFFTPVVSLMAEAGLGVRYSSWNIDFPCNGAICRSDGGDLFVDPLFFVGPRFILSDSFAIAVRIGWPYLSVGASFLL